MVREMHKPRSSLEKKEPDDWLISDKKSMATVSVALFTPNRENLKLRRLGVCP
jgi:hypothetical protein